MCADVELRIKGERDVNVRENGGVGKLDKGTGIAPIVTYGCETWVLKENIIQKLSVFERRILRKIFGPTKMNDGTWRIKTNMELDNLIQHRNVINYVKSKRMSWFGHIHRKPETSVVKKIYKWQPLCNSTSGKTKKQMG